MPAMNQSGSPWCPRNQETGSLWVSSSRAFTGLAAPIVMDRRTHRVASRASLKDVRARSSKAEILELLETGRGQMPSFRSLAALEKRALVAFLFGEGGEERIDA